MDTYTFDGHLFDADFVRSCAKDVAEMSCTAGDDAAAAIAKAFAAGNVDFENYLRDAACLGVLLRVAEPDSVAHPPHYTSHPSGVECITVTEHMNFCLGNAMKYIWRAGSKGDAVEDLKKARWYIDREIARLTANR